MKKWLGRFLVGVTVAAMIIASSGCGQDDGTAKRTGSNTKSVKDILDAQKSSESDASQAGNVEDGSGEATAASDPAKDASTQASAETGSSVGDGEASVSSGEGQASVSSGEGASEEFVPDVDLTALSSTMVYSEVYNMMTAPSDYIGKNVKMKGAFSYYQDPNTGNEYYACIIQDATACCAQGIEFVLAGDHKYPDDYPEMNSEITVAGIFDTYMEGEYTYCTLKNARFVQ